VRKSTARTSDDKTLVREQYFVCSCQGVKGNGRKKTRKSDTEEIKRRKTKCPRTDCKASIRVKMNNEGQYEVISHVLQHNHDTVKEQHTHFLRSQRRIDESKGELIKSMLSAGIAPVDSYNFMCKDAGGETLVGHTLKDHYNFLTRLKISTIESGDAQTLIDIISTQVLQVFFQHGKNFIPLRSNGSEIQFEKRALVQQVV
jgi:hypothetical protein